MSVGVFMGTALTGQDLKEVWEGYERMLRAEPQQQALVRQFAETEGGCALLDDSRRIWRERGFDAPFEFVFEEEPVSAQELR